ncbi:TadE/TadG family type IV pilus assembly protein [Fictibacillus sp. BK138]|uniref:TadE/TadG family type IV pilus assembly protein n=1 Tax=Fictibacillus sp. BK138 TaxID=2512121 RepID=UPI00102A75B9|nr:TadE/TadG family type IV pilus assembly protein [Fictibacillus sp. BK138]RZT21093.1 putative Flp pilus-assembly TadE/G-like protein [Fictibacillus sp. BK138]
MRRLIKKEEGNTIILVAFSLVALIAMTGLIIDGGKLFLTKTHLQKTANAAVLSGAQELTHEEESVRTIVHETLEKHSENHSLEDMKIQMEDKVSVDLSREVPLTFSQLFGFDTVPVNVHAAAELGTMGKAAGVAPLGIDESLGLEFNKEYSLKVDQTGVEAGNFGVLALGGTGAATYEDNLLKGYLNELEVGDVLETQTGNIAGKTRAVIQERINSCPYPEGETHHRDCSRIILIPVYEKLESDGNQLKEVKITGFAYFYITKPMDSKDTSITGMFIKRAGTGFVKPVDVNKGAFSIRLTE